nr:nonspecific lipid transfer protein 11 [Solanum melongena]WJJ08755.1 nsLTP11 [Solanum melongena]
MALRMLSKKSLIFFLLICLVLSPPPARAVITCDTVYNDLQPCLSYVLFGGSVPTECCDGLKSLLANAANTLDRQGACSCVKNLASAATDEQINHAASIPGQCSVKVPFTISRDVDCSKVESKKRG